MANANSLRILQITDTHLYDDPADNLKGVDTDASLRRVLRAAFADNAAYDCVLATGDLSHDGTAAAYRKLYDQCAPLPAPVYCLPGNHDDAAVMRAELNRAPVSCPPEILFDAWQVVLLDTTVAGESHGHLAEDQLIQLAQSLSAYPEHHALICLHHPPLPVGCPWLDAMGLRNSADLFAVLTEHANVRGVLSGHVHQATALTFSGIPVWTSPSTCVQFQPGSETFTLDARGPGYRWMELFADGKIETEAVWVER